MGRIVKDEVREQILTGRPSASSDNPRRASGVLDGRRFSLSRSACGLRLGESYLGVGNQLRQSTLVIQTSSFLLSNRVGGAIFFGDAMKKQTQVFQSLAIGLLVLGMAVVGSRLNAQQTSSSPVDTRAQAQEPQGQQPAQQPGQE